MPAFANVDMKCDQKEIPLTGKGFHSKTCAEKRIDAEIVDDAHHRLPHRPC